MIFNANFITLCSIHPWQFGMLNLTEDGGNRVIKYTDQIYQGVSVSWFALDAAYALTQHIFVNAGFSE